MTMMKTTVCALLSVLLSAAASAGHHEKGEGPMLAAKPGQIVIVYERDASPYPYSAAPALHADGAVVSIDVHSSAESMEKAVAWQGADAAWQAQFAEMEAACGSVDDLSTNVLTMK